MNKIYLLTAAFAVMASLSGCSDTELASIDTAQEKTPIGFHTVGSQMGSRATIINSGDITKTDFKVYAFDGEGNAFMGNNDTEPGRHGVEINHKTGEWDYANSSDLRYWPDYSLDFYAVSPGTVPEENSQDHYFWQINNNSQTIIYNSFDEYGTSSTHQNLDVMYAVAKGQTKANGKVNLTFKHILSQVLFKAKTNDDKLEVEINGINFHNAQLAGSFTIPAGEPQRIDWTQFPTASTLKVGMDGQVTVKSTGTDVFTKPMLFVPQVLSPWVPSDKNIDAANKDKLTYLEISCRIKQNNTYLFGKNSFETLYVPFSATWEPGKRYVYTLIFGGGYDRDGKAILQPINFDPSVEDWGNVDDNTSTDKDIPLYQ